MIKPLNFIDEKDRSNHVADVLKIDNISFAILYQKYSELNQNLYSTSQNELEIVKNEIIDELKKTPIDIAQLEIVFIHYSNFSDRGESLDKFGLLTLPSVLTLDTSIKRFLNLRGIDISYEKKMLIIEEEKYTFDELSEMSCNSLKAALLVDKEICGFYNGEKNQIEYIQDVISKAPEFLAGIDMCFGTTLVEQWSKQERSNLYKIVTQAKIYAQGYRLSEEKNAIFNKLFEYIFDSHYIFTTNEDIPPYKIRYELVENQS